MSTRPTPERQQLQSRLHVTSSVMMFLGIIAFFWVLYIGKAILVPFVVAIFCWYLVNAMADGFRRWLPNRPNLRISLAGLLFLAILSVPIQLITLNSEAIVEAAPQYQSNIQVALYKLLEEVGLDIQPVVQRLTEFINLGTLAKAVADALAGLAGNAVMILLYLLFMLAEQSSFRRKLAAWVQDRERLHKVEGMLQNIRVRVQQYLWIKTMLSLMTAAIGWVIMAWVGLDFATFWAVLIFFLNYIPNIGAAIATILPVSMALVQFTDLTPAILIASGLGLTQFILGNILEPKWMGDSLNLSPLVILLGLVVWGSLWGVVGMYLSVPIMVMLVIVCAEFPATRPIAILLSEKGDIFKKPTQ